MVGRILSTFLLGGVLLAPIAPAIAEAIRIDAHWLPPTPDWQRAAPDEEAAQESVILRWMGEGEPITVFIPQHSVALKVDEARFRQQLAQRWRAQYGRRARIFEAHLGSKRWLICRRPSLESEATVFHLASVEHGRAVHLLAITSAAGESLPAPLAQLLADAHDSAYASPALADTHVPAQTPQIAAGLDLPPAKPNADAALTPDAAKDAPTLPPPAQTNASSSDSLPAPWRLRRSVLALPQGEALTRIARAEAARMSPPVELVAYGLRAREHGVQGFIDGTRTKKNGAPTRRPLVRHWRVHWSAPGETLRPEDELALSVHVDLASLPLPPAVWTLRARFYAVCGRREALIATFDALARHDPAGRRRLAQHQAECGPIPTLEAQARAANETGSGKTVLTLTPDADWMARLPVFERSRVVRLVLHLEFVAKPEAMENEASFGASLWQAAAAYYIYVPASG